MAANGEKQMAVDRLAKAEVRRRALTCAPEEDKHCGYCRSRRLLALAEPARVSKRLADVRAAPGCGSNGVTSECPDLLVIRETGRR